MEDPKSGVVLDISSEEEADCGYGGGGAVDFGWIRGLLDDDDYENKEEPFKDGFQSNDSDDVLLFTGGVPVDRNESVLKSSSGVVNNSSKGSDDDECVVLDGDPDNPTAVDKKGGSVDGSGDDLVVVSEKGEVACRDFPHPRHLCAKFPFSSSGHAMHCDQCHCYVCDSLAPCVYWGTGVSSFDHCHATDKEAFWKSQRCSLRSAKVSPSAISMKKMPISNQSSPLMPNLVQQNQGLIQFTVRPCSMPTNSGIPNVTRQGPPPGYVVPRSKYQTHLLSQHLADTSPHVSLTGRRHNNSNMGPQRARFKRSVPAGSSLDSDVSGHNPSRLNYGSRLPTNLPATHRWQVSHGGMTSVSHAYQSSYLPNVGEVADMLCPQTDPVLGNRFSHTMLPPQTLFQQSRGSGDGNGILLQPEMASQQHTSTGYTSYMPQPSSHRPVNDVSENLVPPQRLVSSCTPENGNFRASLVSGPQRNYQPDICHGFMNTTPKRHQLTSLTQQSEGRTIGYSEPTQSQSFRQFEADTEFLPFPLPNTGSSSIDPFLTYHTPVYNQSSIIANSHDSLQQKNQTILEALGSNVAVSDYCTTPIKQLSGYNSQLQNVEQTGPYSVNTNIYHQYPSPTDFGTTEAWLSVDNRVPKARGISVPPLLNTPFTSPELASLDGGAGLFFH